MPVALITLKYAEFVLIPMAPVAWATSGLQNKMGAESAGAKKPSADPYRARGQQGLRLAQQQSTSMFQLDGAAARNEELQ